MFHAIWEFTQSAHCVTQSENSRLRIIQNLQIPYKNAIHAIWGSGIAHEFRLHSRPASSSNVSAFATMSTSAEEQHRQLFEEFCVRIYAAARSKTISQREAGSEFTEKCDADGGAQVRRTV